MPHGPAQFHSRQVEIDYRSVLGEIIRDHLGATQNQLNRIIPACANESSEHLLNGGLVGTTPILGELGIV